MFEIVEHPLPVNYKGFDTHYAQPVSRSIEHKTPALLRLEAGSAKSYIPTLGGFASTKLGCVHRSPPPVSSFLCFFIITYFALLNQH